MGQKDQIFHLSVICEIHLNDWLKKWAEKQNIKLCLENTFIFYFKYGQVEEDEVKEKCIHDSYKKQ